MQTCVVQTCGQCMCRWVWRCIIGPYLLFFFRMATVIKPKEVGGLLDFFEAGTSQRFQPIHLQRLANAGYDDVETLQLATLNDLVDAGLPRAKARLVLEAIAPGRVQSWTLAELSTPFAPIDCMLTRLRKLFLYKKFHYSGMGHLYKIPIPFAPSGCMLSRMRNLSLCWKISGFSQPLCCILFLIRLKINQWPSNLWTYPWRLSSCKNSSQEFGAEFVF